MEEYQEDIQDMIENIMKINFKNLLFECKETNYKGFYIQLPKISLDNWNNFKLEMENKFDKNIAQLIFTEDNKIIIAIKDSNLTIDEILENCEEISYNTLSMI